MMARALLTAVLLICPAVSADGHCSDSTTYSLYSDPAECTGPDGACVCADWGWPAGTFISYCAYEATVVGIVTGTVPVADLPESWQDACDMTSVSNEKVECNVATLENGNNIPVPAGTAVGIGDGFDAATGGFVPKEDWETIQDECGVSCGTCKRKHVIESFDKINDATRLPGWGFCRTEDAQKSNPSEHFSALAQVPGSESYQTKCVSNTTGYQACRPNALQPLSPV